MNEELKVGDVVTENGTEWMITAITKDSDGNIQAVEKTGAASQIKG